MVRKTIMAFNLAVVSPIAPKHIFSVPPEVLQTTSGVSRHPLADLTRLTRGMGWNKDYLLPYGLKLSPPLSHDTMQAAMNLGLRWLHDPRYGHPVEVAIPINGSWNGKLVISWDAMTGFTPRDPFVREFVDAGYAFVRFPLPPIVRRFGAIDWDTLFPITVAMSRQHPELLYPGLIGFGYSQGGLIAALWAELSTGVTGEAMASRLLSTRRMTPLGRRQFIADMDWLGSKLKEIGYRGIAASTPHGGMSFSRARAVAKIRAFVDTLSPHLLASYEPAHRAQFSSAALAGNVVVTWNRHIPPIEPSVRLAVSLGMGLVHGLNTMPGPHDLFVPEVSQHVPGIPTTRFTGTHMSFPSSREGAKTVLGLLS